jgi:glycosyltransferase involved in cell wall biosynthesis
MISVLMPTFNAEKYLDTSIQSIIKQNFKDFELIIFDDCSTDDSYKIIKKYSLLDKRIIHHKNSTNTGYTDLLNEMAKIAKYDFIARMDADDISHKNRLTKQIEFIYDKKYYSVVGSFIKIIDEKGNFLRDGKYPLEDLDIKEDLKKYSTFAHPSTLIRKSFFEEVKGYRKICEPAEDYDLWTRLASISKLHNLPEFLLSYREHQKGISQRKREEQLIKTEFIKKNYLHILKGKDLVKEKNLVEINEQLLYDLINKNEFIFEKNYSLLASYLKNKKFFKFTYIFLKTLIKNPKFLSCRVFSYIKKKYGYK